MKLCRLSAAEETRQQLQPGGARPGREPPRAEPQRRRERGRSVCGNWASREDAATRVPFPAGPRSRAASRVRGAPGGSSRPRCARVPGARGRAPHTPRRPHPRFRSRARGVQAPETSAAGFNNRFDSSETWRERRTWPWRSYFFCLTIAGLKAGHEGEGRGAGPPARGTEGGGLGRPLSCWARVARGPREGGRGELGWGAPGPLPLALAQARLSLPGREAPLGARTPLPAPAPLPLPARTARSFLPALPLQLRARGDPRAARPRAPAALSGSEAPGGGAVAALPGRGRSVRVCRRLPRARPCRSSSARVPAPAAGRRAPASPAVALGVFLSAPPASLCLRLPRPGCDPPPRPPPPLPAPGRPPARSLGSGRGPGCAQPRGTRTGVRFGGVGRGEGDWGARGEGRRFCVRTAGLARARPDPGSAASQTLLQSAPDERSARRRNKWAPRGQRARGRRAEGSCAPSERMGAQAKGPAGEGAGPHPAHPPWGAEVAGARIRVGRVGTQQNPAFC